MENLKEHIGKFVEFSENEFEEIFNDFTFIKVPEKQNLSLEGKICLSNYFVKRAVCGYLF